MKHTVFYGLFKSSEDLLSTRGKCYHIHPPQCMKHLRWLTSGETTKEWRRRKEAGRKEIKEVLGLVIWLSQLAHGVKYPPPPSAHAQSKIQGEMIWTAEKGCLFLVISESSLHHPDLFIRILVVAYVVTSLQWPLEGSRVIPRIWKPLLSHLFTMERDSFPPQEVPSVTTVGTVLATWLVLAARPLHKARAGPSSSGLCQDKGRVNTKLG